MDEHGVNRVSGGGAHRFVKYSPRARFLAGVLSLVYLGGWAFAGWAFSIRVDDHWPARLIAVVGTAWFAMMLSLPLVIVILFFGGPRNPAWLRGRFSLRTALVALTLVAVVLGLVVWAAELFNPTT